VLDLQTEQHDHGQSCQDLYEAVIGLKRRHDLHPCAVRPRDGLALRRDSERELVSDLVKRFRELPADQQRRLPALLNSLAQLQVVVGDLEAGQHDFLEVARLVSDPISQAEAHHNVYRAALERRDWGEALAALRRAAALDAEAFEPFPLSRYEPIRILGGGGFGVSVLCQDREAGCKVVVKTLRGDSLDRDLGGIFREQAVVQELDHPAVVRVREFAHADAEARRPYLALDYFEGGQTLAEHIAVNGPFTPEDWLHVGWPLARALQALHGRGVLHRSLRPAAVLIRLEQSDRGKRWRVKLLDAGLSLRRSLVHAAGSHPEAQVQTGLGRSVARTVAYAPPEVVGKPKGLVWVGPHSDLYSFGKLCAFALTGRPNPDGGDLVLLSEGWRGLLDACTAWTIGRRPPHIGVVLDRLSELAGSPEVVQQLEHGLHEQSVAEHTAQLDLDPDDVTALVNRAAAYSRQGEPGRALADLSRALELQPSNPALYRRRGLTHAHLGNLDRAVADYTDALRLEPRNAEAYANRGLAHAQREEHEQAVADFTEALKVNSRDEALLFNRGNSYFARGDQERALADYSETVRLNPSHVWAFGCRARVHQARGEHRKAVDDLNRVLHLEPTNVRALWERAASFLELGKQERAVADYTEALRLEPSAVLYLDRGLAHARGGDLEAAVADFGEALSLEGTNAAALLFRGRAQADLDRLPQALADLDEAVRLSPESASAHFSRGNVHVRLNDPTSALADLTRTLELEPHHAVARCLRANLHRTANRPDEAVADFSAALEREPRDPAALLGRSACYMDLGDLEKAQSDLDAALAVDPANATVFAARARLRLRQDDADGALDDYNEAVRLDPADARLYYSRGCLLVGRGDVDRARNDFNQAIERDPKLAAAYYQRGNLYLEQRDHEAAIVDFTEVLTLEPQHAAALNIRGSARARLGDWSGACADFTAAIELTPAAPQAFYNRANAYCECGELEKALADYDEALRRDGADVAALLNRGRVLLLLQRRDEALRDNLEALRLSPDDVRTCNNLAWLLATHPQPEKRDPPRAVELARRACQLTESKDPTALDTLAAALAANGAFQEAADVQRQALDLAAEEDKPPYRQRLELYEAERAYQEA
jgi:tetratricopeptide (TPR) repeat protein